MNIRLGEFSPIFSELEANYRCSIMAYSPGDCYRQVTKRPEILDLSCLVRASMKGEGQPCGDHTVYRLWKTMVGPSFSGFNPFLSLSS